MMKNNLQRTELYKGEPTCNHFIRKFTIVKLILILGMEFQCRGMLGLCMKPDTITGISLEAGNRPTRAATPH